jgi:hypothetical protein
MTSTLLTCTSGLRPTSPSDCDTLFETDTNRIIVWDDTNSLWRTYNSDAVALNTTGVTELHYPTGLWSSASATYYISTSAEVHFDASIMDGADAVNNPADGASISTWGDRSGSGATYQATQASASLQPAFTVSGPGLKPATTWGSDSMALATQFTTTGSLTQITVSQSNDASNNAVTGSQNGSGYGIWNKETGNDWSMGANKGDHSAPEDFTMHTLRRDGTSAELFEDGGTSIITWTSSGTRADLGVLGKSYPSHPGTISEILLFNSALSTADLNVIRLYLVNKYSLTTVAFT